ncbi:MAG: DUF86 domain-containing protein [Limnohabitans sp.]|nr:DUF86 domain-containing protein [Limnohabitans sp.]
MSKSPIDYLIHILLECEYINSVLTENIDYDKFINDETLKRAIVRSLEIIGEATKQITADIKYKWNNIKWKNITGMRDKLIHDYIGVNYSIVWDVAKNRIPELIIQINEIIDNEKDKFA